VVLQGVGQPRLEVPLPCPDLPELVLNVITGIQVRQCSGWLQLVCREGGGERAGRGGGGGGSQGLRCPNLRELVLNVSPGIQLWF
jgi:hypothetical protein